MGCGASTQISETAPVALPPQVLNTMKEEQQKEQSSSKHHLPSGYSSKQRSELDDSMRLNLVQSNKSGVVQGVGKAKKETAIAVGDGETTVYKPLRRGSYSSNPTGTTKMNGTEGKSGETDIQAVAAVDEAMERPPNPFVQGQLRNIMFLAHLDDTLLDRIARMFDLKEYAVDDFVIQQGQKGTHLYVVKSGKIKGWSADEPGKVYVQYSPGQIFGELTYLFPSKKTFLNITAEEPSEVYRIEHEMLRMLVRAEQILKMKKYDEILSKVDIFQLNSDKRMILIEQMTVVEHAYGDTLTKKGEALDRLGILPESLVWIVEEGGLEVTVEVDGRPTTVFNIEEGDYFPSFLVDCTEKRQWTATVSTTAPSRILVIERTAILKADAQMWRRCKDSPESVRIIKAFSDKIEALLAEGRTLDYTLKTRPTAA